MLRPKIGDKLGKLTIIGYDRVRRWKVKCECGAVAYRSAVSMRAETPMCRACRMKPENRQYRNFRKWRVVCPPTD